VDIHTHGIGPHLYEQSPEALLAATEFLARFGTTTVLPTLYTTLTPGHLDHLAALAGAAKRVTSCRIAGFHLEGPFLALSGAAGRQLPADVGLLRELLAACAGRARVMSVSPEVTGIIAVIEELVRAGIMVFLTHTAADVATTLRAIDAGARHATHFYDVFPAPAERAPGVRPCGAVEAILADERCSVDFIADGVHVEPAAIGLAAACKSWRGVCLITDSNLGTGLPTGRYPTAWGFPVRVSPDDAARIDDPAHPEYGGLAGSSLTLNRAVANVRRWFGLSDDVAFSLATANPARIAGLAATAAIAPGSPADVVLWNDDLTAATTILNGSEVFGAV